MTYNRDMQEDKEPLFDAADQLRGSLQMIRVVTETVVLRPAIRPEPQPRKAGSSRPTWPKRWRATELLFIRRIRSSAGLCSRACRRGRSPADWTAETLSVRAGVHPEMAALLSPVEGMKTRELPGGTAPEAVAAGARRGGITVERHGVNKTYRQGQILRLIKTPEDSHAGPTCAGACGAGDFDDSGYTVPRYPRIGSGENA